VGLTRLHGQTLFMKAPNAIATADPIEFRDAKTIEKQTSAT
jgi:hypothetical protein